MQNIFGCVDSDMVHFDVSMSKTAAKRWATINGYTKVSCRFNCGAIAGVVTEKIDGKWVDV